MFCGFTLTHWDFSIWGSNCTFSVRWHKSQYPSIYLDRDSIRLILKMLFEVMMKKCNWCQRPMHCWEAKRRKLNIQKLTRLHNLSSVMTMCPSILASICAPLSAGERVVNCADTNVPNPCTAPVRTMPCEGCNQRTPCTTHRGGAAVRANINWERGANRAVMWELSVYADIYTSTVRSMANKWIQSGSVAHKLVSTVVLALTRC